ncbi:hypothetical protein [Chryseobacterium sp. Leaf201]|uniref:hypothetical protein n=1 Tax=Chryseobacterium sp. Leaf201 TaxID=1735672 RepID=UPI0006F4DD78|nr:hypothetical protein [Chryseobacterium sp. Leaf201]KQM41688.1 hypothetical protein ASE55_03480 [Chryseobacterium sp. Leaf201]
MEAIAILKNKANALLSLTFTVLMSLTVFAQDTAGELVTKENSSKSTTTTEWYADPMYIIAGAVLLIIIIALITRSGRRR